VRFYRMVHAQPTGRARAASVGQLDDLGDSEPRRPGAPESPPRQADGGSRARSGGKQRWCGRTEAARALRHGLGGRIHLLVASDRSSPGAHYKRLTAPTAGHEGLAIAAPPTATYPQPHTALPRHNRRPPVALIAPRLERGGDGDRRASCLRLCGGQSPALQRGWSVERAPRLRWRDRCASCRQTSSLPAVFTWWIRASWPSVGRQATFAAGEVSVGIRSRARSISFELACRLVRPTSNEGTSCRPRRYTPGELPSRKLKLHRQDGRCDDTRYRAAPGVRLGENPPFLPVALTGRSRRTRGARRSRGGAV